MRLLIIVTADAPGYLLWEKTKGWQGDDVLADRPVRVGSVGQDRIVILCQAESTVGGESERERDIRRKTTPWVLKIANSQKYAAVAKVYVAAHDKYVDLKQLRAGIAKERFGACAFFNHEPKARDLDVISDALYPLIDKPSAEAYETALDAVKKEQALTHVQRLSVLKHRLAHLFLPISVDLQAWREFDYDDEYMEAILDSYKQDEGRLGRAREPLYAQALSPGNESVEKIVKEVKFEGSPAWAEINSLLPKTDPASPEEKARSASFVDVFQTKQLLESLKNKDQLTELKSFLKTDNPLTQWYTKLEAALIKLREEMDAPPQG
jgi:hypothetical protein